MTGVKGLVQTVQQRWSKWLVGGDRCEQILSVLIDGPVRGGLSLVSAIETAYGTRLPRGVTDVYPMLHALIEQGLVEYSFEEGTELPKRKIYEITEKGKKQYEALTAS